MLSTGARVLVVDDDPEILKMLERVLTDEGFVVDTTSSARQAIGSLDAKRPDVILLDVMLAGENGFEALTELRRQHDVPIILVTGRGAESDRVLGLRLGADDYVVKPFSYPELSARISSVLRRTSPKPAAETMSAGRVVVDSRTREVFVDGQLIETTAKEFDLLSFLVASPRQVFSRQQLLEHVWDSSSSWQDPSTVTEHVRRLRLKIEEEPDKPRLIVTIRGIGYRFEP